MLVMYSFARVYSIMGKKTKGKGAKFSLARNKKRRAQTFILLKDNMSNDISCGKTNTVTLTHMFVSTGYVYARMC